MKDVMTKKEKSIKIEFAPGAFDNFDGTQEELDELLAEIQYMFVNKSRAEIESMSRPLTDEDLEGLPDEVKEQMIRGIDSETPPRTLQ
jgi:sugar/nucleoside kinase (ribokinase family)